MLFFCSQIHSRSGWLACARELEDNRRKSAVACVGREPLREPSAEQVILGIRLEILEGLRESQGPLHRQQQQRQQHRCARCRRAYPCSKATATKFVKGDLPAACRGHTSHVRNLSKRWYALAKFSDDLAENAAPAGYQRTGRALPWTGQQVIAQDQG
jgi:hypothetical protein